LFFVYITIYFIKALINRLIFGSKNKIEKDNYYAIQQIKAQNQELIELNKKSLEK
jgi:hypothetical protein